ncbi:MAG: hypothetical protein KGQ59_03580 [Bdellovibrionales bacterium]|nr:hypothetical protein [Bdellovibrionales bacterium]
MKKNKNLSRFAVLAVLMLTGALGQTTSHALDLDWAGDFRAENHWLSNYRMNSANPQPGAPGTTRGYAVAGANKAQFQSLFFRLKPRVIVNDNVYLHSEWWFGSPAYGFFGDAGPTQDRNSFNSTFSDGGTLTAQRFWAEILTDVGNVHVGRAPLQWGLGLVWNAGDGLYDRFQSTGDVIRMVSKFGAFSFAPAAVKYTSGSSISGSSVSDYAIALKYENSDEEFEGGVNFIRRVGTGLRAFNETAFGDVNMTTWDIFTRKKLGKFELLAESPIVTGKVSGGEYSTYALALEGRYAASDSWNFFTKAGHVPGQSGDEGKFRGYFLHPNYKLGLILFNYQFAHFGINNVGSGANGSVFNAPITNANYLHLGGDYTSGKWQFRGSWTYAQARETAGTTGRFYNQWTRSFENAGGSTAQSSSLGWELDAGTTLKWDDHFEFKADAGLFFPGDFFKYTGTATENQTGTIAAFVMGIGTKF